MTPDADSRRATLVGATAVLLWSTLAALTTLSGDIPPFQLLAMTFTPAFLLGLALWTWEDRRDGRRSAGTDADASNKDPGSRGRWRLPLAVWALGIYGLFGYHFAYFMGMRLAPPVEAGLLNYLWPLLIVIFSGFLPGERLRRRQVAGALLGFAGAGLIVTRGRGIYVDLQFLPGYAFAVAAGIIWASYSVLSRRARAVPTSAVGAFCGATAVLALLCHLLLEQTVWPSGGQWAAVLGLGLGPVGLAFYTWDYGVKRGDIQTLGALAYAAPLLSTGLLVALGLAEPSWVLAAAAALITGGAVLASGRSGRG
ncbi:MAG: DMT family transporter [Candidatus Promineofilum sp.]|nr:DMT family transporter [Promineifilum sp.]